MTIHTRSLLAGVALLPMAATAFAPDACAQTAQPPQPQIQADPAGAARDFEIAGGALDAALVAYARQANVQLLYTADLVAGLRTQGVVGRHPPEAALRRLLAGTGIRWSRSRPGVIVLRRSSNAQADLGEATEIDEVIVTGTLLRGPGESPSPVTVISRGELDRRGDATVADALVRLPQSYSGNATPNSLLLGADSLGSNTATATGVNLRGLGADATLVLVNGRRLAGTGMKGEFADVSALPGGAVERVDVLLDGASALYGSDAVAGVVNVILRRTYEGQETRLRASAAQGGGEDLLASHLVGTRWQGGSALLSYEYQHQSPLNSADRDYAATGDLTPWGGTDRRSFYGPPGSIVVFDAARGAYRSSYAIRPGPDGTARSPADFEAGGANLGNRRAGVDILPLQERHSAYASVRQTLGSHVEVSADARFSRRAYEYANLAPVSILTVGSANPFFVSPTGAASHLIAYNFIGDLGPTESYGVSRSLGGTAGIEIALPRDWTLEAYGAFAEELSEGGTNNQLNSTFLSEALGNTADNPATPYSPMRDGYFNPFGSGAANGEAVLDFISQGYTWSRYRSRISSANLMLDGSPLTLPGGDLRIAVGAAFRREAFNRRSRNFASGLAPIVTIGDPQVRDIGAVFAEARIPLVGSANALPGIERLELTLAGRAEHYDDVGSTTNPKIGLIWQPSEPVTVRASWGTSFRAPALTEVFDRVQVGPLTVADAGVSRVAILQSGGNTDLEPETAESLTVGLEWAPRPGLRFSAGYFDIRFENKIGRPALENITSILVDPSLAPFVTRLTPGDPADLARVQAFLADPRFTSPTLYPASAYSVILDGRWANTGELSVEGLDLGATYDFSLGDNAFGLSVSTSYLLDYSRRVTPVAAREDVLGVVGFPVDLRAQAAATWTRGDWSTRIGLNHASDYRDLAGRTIDAFTTLAAGRFYDLELAPDGDRLALVETAAAAPFDPAGPFEPQAIDRERRLRLVDLRTGDLSSPLGEADVAPSLLSWSPRSNRLLVWTRGPAGWAAGDLVAVDPATGAAERYARGDLQPYAGGGVAAFNAVYADWLGDRPSRTLATINDYLAEVDFPPPEPVRHLGPDGRERTSWLYRPRSWRGEKIPLVVLSYPGGPAAPPAEPAALNAWANPQLVVGGGYAVLIPVLALDRDKEPAEDYARDVLTVVDAALAQYPVLDPGRVAHWGHSFGGYVGLVAATQTDRFKAIISVAGLSDLATAWGEFSPSNRDNPEFGLSLRQRIGWAEESQGRMRAPPWAAPDRYVRNSPLFAADRITAPVLLVHGDRDLLPSTQSEIMFSALWRQNKDARLLTYWGEGQAIPEGADEPALVALRERSVHVEPEPGPGAGGPEGSRDDG